MAIRGVARSTLDLDLLVTSRICLRSETWESLRREGPAVEIRKGDSEDPLAGVIRLELKRESPVDVIVGRARWQDEILQRAELAELGDVTLPVATASDLVLLKLFAGGAQDRWDVQQLLAGPDHNCIASQVTAELPKLPARCRKAWRELSGI